MHGSTHRWIESRTHATREAQLTSAIEANQERIDSQAARRVSANDELLPTLVAKFHPAAGSPTRFIRAIPSLGDNPLESVRSYELFKGSKIIRPCCQIDVLTAFQDGPQQISTHR